MPKSCDTMVALPSATKENQTIFAKNSDRPATECQPLVQRARETHPAWHEHKMPICRTARSEHNLSSYRFATLLVLGV